MTFIYIYICDIIKISLKIWTLFTLLKKIVFNRHCHKYTNYIISYNHKLIIISQIVNNPIIYSKLIKLLRIDWQTLGFDVQEGYRFGALAGPQHPIK